MPFNGHDRSLSDFPQGIGKDNSVDILFGGLSGKTEAGADVIDYRPRPVSTGTLCTDAGTEFSDPCSWFEMTGLKLPTKRASGADILGPKVYDGFDTQATQHHQGIDWQYGGQGRDVLQGNVGKKRSRSR